MFCVDCYAFLPKYDDERGTDEAVEPPPFMFRPVKSETDWKHTLPVSILSQILLTMFYVAGMDILGILCALMLKVCNHCAYLDNSVVLLLVVEGHYYAYLCLSLRDVNRSTRRLQLELN